MILLGPDFRLPPQFGPLQLFFFLFSVQAVARAQTKTTSNYTLSSYYRDPARNKAVGGVEGSLHTVGLAMDVTSSARALLPALDLITFRLAEKNALGNVQRAWQSIAPPYTQGVLEGDHVHLELDL